MTIEIETQMFTATKERDAALVRKDLAVSEGRWDDARTERNLVNDLNERLDDMQAKTAIGAKLAEQRRQREAVVARPAAIAALNVEGLSDMGTAFDSVIATAGAKAQELTASLVEGRNALVMAVMAAAPNRLLAADGIQPIPDMDVYILRRLVGAGVITTRLLSIPVSSADRAVDIGTVVKRYATNLAAQAASAPVHVLDAAE